MTRLLAILAFAFVVFAGSRADAQVFKPRGKAAAAKTAKKTEKAPAKADGGEKPATKKARRNTTAAKAPKKARATDAGRSETPAKKGKKGKGKRAVDEDDDVALGDDEVIITDDDD